MEQAIAQFPVAVLLLAQYSPGVVGFVMPILVEVVNRNLTNHTWKFIVTLLLCLLVAALLNLRELSSAIMVGDLKTVAGLLAFLTVIFTQSQVAFKLWFEKSTLRQSMQREVIISQ